MKDKLISYETAKLAKEKGFNQKLTESGCHIRGECIDFPLDLMNGKDVYATPTQSLLQKWLRDVHEIYVLPDKVHINHEDGVYTWVCIVEDEDGDSFQVDDHEIYEEVLEQGLGEALQLIKTNDND